MSGNNKILLLLITGLVFTACHTTSIIPEAYNFKAKEIRNNPYGCWTIMEYKLEQGMPQPETISGELLFMDADTLFLLVSDSNVYPIFSGSVIKAELFTHKNMADNYFGATTLWLIPSVIGTIAHSGEYGLGFLVIGIPVAVVGILNIIIEGSSTNNILTYPGKTSLENLSKYGRWPAGRPLNVDLKDLKLKQLQLPR